MAAAAAGLALQVARLAGDGNVSAALQLAPSGFVIPSNTIVAAAEAGDVWLVNWLLRASNSGSPDLPLQVLPPGYDDRAAAIAAAFKQPHNRVQLVNDLLPLQPEHSVRFLQSTAKDQAVAHCDMSTLGWMVSAGWFSDWAAVAVAAAEDDSVPLLEALSERQILDTADRLPVWPQQQHLRAALAFCSGYMHRTEGAVYGRTVWLLLRGPGSWIRFSAWRSLTLPWSAITD
jgi:hypothetical protein